MLDQVPLEILQIILYHIDEKEDLQSLAAASKYLNQAATPYLYETVTINLLESSLGFSKSLQNLLRISPRGLTHIKNLVFTAPFRAKKLRRCLHYNPLSDQARLFMELAETGECVKPADPVEKFAEDILQLLRRLGDDSLRGFSWHLGICLPQSILGPHGYLRKHQRSIQDFSLIMGNACEFQLKQPMESAPLIGFVELRSLRSLSWKYSQTPNDLVGLGLGVTVNGSTLESLTIDATHWGDFSNVRQDDATEHSGGNNRFALFALGLEPGSSLVLFRILRKLSLERVAFHGMASEMQCAFNFSTIRSLVLHDCKAADQFLDSIVQADQPGGLTSFEFTDGAAEFLQPSRDALHRFLGVLRGLKSLHISICSLIDWHRTTKEIARHSATLEDLVVQTLDVGLLDSLLEIRPPLIPPNFPTCKEEFVPYWKRCMGFVLRCEKLRSIALSPTPEFLLQHLPSLCQVTKPSWELCHIRPHPRTFDRYVHAQIQSNAEGGAAPGGLLEFAQWAFGPEGLPNLRILAWGVFGLHGRYDGINKLLCRNEAFRPGAAAGGSDPLCLVGSSDNSNRSSSSSGSMAFRELRRDDYELREGLLRRNAEMLAACPEERLMYA